MAPDGKWLAAGGFSRTGGDHWIYIFDVESGAIATRLGRFSQIIEQIVISTDGRFLAATFRNGLGVRIWERKDSGFTNWQPVGQDSNYDGKSAFGATFGQSGILYTVSYDHKIRRYAPGSWSSPKIATTRSGGLPYSIAVRPKGDLLAVGFSDARVVDLYDSTTLTWRSAVKAGEAGEGGLEAVAWSLAGDRLYAAGANEKLGNHVIRVWENIDGDAPREIKGPTDAVFQLVPCGENIAVAAADPAFGLLDGTSKLWRGREGADMRGKLGDNFTVSADGLRVRFGLKRAGGEPVLFDLAEQKLVDSPSPSADLTIADITSLPVAGWGGSDNRRPRIGSVALEIENLERALSLAISPDKQTFVLGGDNYIRAFTEDGTLIWRQQAPGTIWGVNISQNGKVVVAASGDGSLRWYGLEKGDPLLSLFVDADSKRWVAWTQGGYFMSSAGGDNLVGWHVNRASDQAADFFPISRFRDMFYRPDVVKDVLATLDHPAVEPGRQPNREGLLENLPPVVRMVSPVDGAAVSIDEVTVEFMLRSPSGRQIQRVFALVEGRPVEGAALTGKIESGKDEVLAKLKIKIPPRDVSISIIAETDRPSVPDHVELKWSGAVSSSTLQPKLYALIVGVGDYANKAFSLGDFPANDADDFAKQLKSQEGEGRAFAAVNIFNAAPLKDRQATQENIVKGLEWLALNAKDSESDIALMYFSGHGASTAGGASYLLPFEFDPEHPILTGIGKARILEVLRQINGKVIFFVDACYGGAGLDIVSLGGTKVRRLDTNGLVSEFAASENGITAFASSSGIELSYPAPDGRNSVFTQAAIKGLLGQAAHFGDKVIMTDDLSAWLRREVPRLTGNKQTPIMIPSPLAKPVPLAVLP